MKLKDQTDQTDQTEQPIWPPGERVKGPVEKYEHSTWKELWRHTINLKRAFSRFFWLGHFHE